MNKEKKKKLLNIIKSSAFCIGFLIFCSIVGCGISLGNYSVVNDLNVLNILGFPIAFAVGINGLIFIPMICDKKLANLEEYPINNKIVEEKVEEKEPQLEIIKKNSCTKEVINTIDNILLENSHIGVKMELLSEWQEYLENTFIDESGIKLVQEIIYYLMLINTLSLEKVIPLVKDREDILDLLIHFSINGENLAKALNRENKDMKKEKTI